MINLNANLTTLASFEGEPEKSNSSIADNYLKAAGICIAAQGGVAFHIVHGKQVPTADTLSIAKILQAQGSQKQSWQPNFGQPKESTASLAVNSHTYFSPEVAPAVSQALGTAMEPQAALTVPSRGKGPIQWRTSNQTKFYKPLSNNDYTSIDLPARQHGAPRSACTWKNTHRLNVGSMAVDMDVSEIGISGYFSSVEPLQGQKAKMIKNLKAGNSIMRDRLIAHSKDSILQQFQFCGRVHPLKEPSGLIGTSLPEPLQEYLPDSRFKNQSAFISPLSSSVQFNGPISQQDDVDIYLVQVHPRNNRKITRDLDNALEDEVNDSMSVSSYGSCGSKANMRQYKGQAKLRISLHSNFQAPEGSSDCNYRFVFALRGAPDMDDTHANRGIASLQSWDLSQIVADIHRLLRVVDCGRNTTFAARSRVTLQRVEIRAATWVDNVQTIPAITETWAIVHLHHCVDSQGNCPYLGTAEELTEFVIENLAEGGVFYAAGLPLCYTEVKPDPERHEEPFYSPLPPVFQTPAGLLSIRNVHKDITADSAITTLEESGLDLSRLTHIAIRRTPQDLAGLGRIPGLVATGDYCMEIELRFQGPPPPLYDLSLTKLKNKGIIRSEAPEGDIWAWHDTPGLNLIRQYVLAEAGLIPYQATLLTGLLNSHKAATVQDLQPVRPSYRGAQRQPRRPPPTNRGRGRGGRNYNRDRDRGPDRVPPSVTTQPASPEQEGRSESGRGQATSRGSKRQNYSADIEEIRGQLARVLSDNDSLRESNAILVAKLAEGDQHREAQPFSLTDVYAEGDEEEEEFTQENGDIGIRRVTARKAGQTPPGNDTKRAKPGPIGERLPT